MDRVTTYTLVSQVASTALNAIQDQAAGLLQLVGTWVGHRPTLEYDGTSMIVGAHRGVVVGTTAGNSVLLPAVSTTETVTLSGLSNNTWYYVYIYNGNTYASPSRAFEVSTTAPDATLNIKTGDASRAYVGCFRTNGSATPLAFRMQNRRYLYRISILGPGGLNVLTPGTDGSYIDVPLSSRVPPHSVLVRLLGVVDGTIGQSADVRTNGDTTSSFPVQVPGYVFDMQSDAAQIIEYQKNTANAILLYVLGFEE